MRPPGETVKTPVSRDEPERDYTREVEGKDGREGREEKRRKREGKKVDR